MQQTSELADQKGGAFLTPLPLPRQPAHRPDKGAGTHGYEDDPDDNVP